MPNWYKGNCIQDNVREPCKLKWSEGLKEDLSPGYAPSLVGSKDWDRQSPSAEVNTGLWRGVLGRTQLQSPQTPGGTLTDFLWPSHDPWEVAKSPEQYHPIWSGVLQPRLLFRKCYELVVLALQVKPGTVGEFILWNLTNPRNPGYFFFYIKLFYQSIIALFHY